MVALPLACGGAGRVDGSLGSLVSLEPVVFPEEGADVTAVLEEGCPFVSARLVDPS